MDNSSTVDLSKGMSPRKAMASDAGNFGVKSIAEISCDSGKMMNPESVMKAGVISDSERMAGRGVRYDTNKMRAQSGPEHGPHK